MQGTLPARNGVKISTLALDTFLENVMVGPDTWHSRPPDSCREGFFFRHDHVLLFRGYLAKSNGPFMFVTVRVASHLTHVLLRCHMTSQSQIVSKRSFHPLPNHPYSRRKRTPNVRPGQDQARHCTKSDGANISPGQHLQHRMNPDSLCLDIPMDRH